MQKNIWYWFEKKMSHSIGPFFRLLKQFKLNLTPTQILRDCGKKITTVNFKLQTHFSTTVHTIDFRLDSLWEKYFTLGLHFRLMNYFFRALILSFTFVFWLIWFYWLDIMALSCFLWLTLSSGSLSHHVILVV